MFEREAASREGQIQAAKIALVDKWIASLQIRLPKCFCGSAWAGRDPNRMPNRHMATATNQLVMSGLI